MTVARNAVLKSGNGGVLSKANQLKAGERLGFMNSTEETPKIRVVIADDHPIVRDGLRKLLSIEDDIDVVGEATDGQVLLDHMEANGGRTLSCSTCGCRTPMASRRFRP